MLAALSAVAKLAAAPVSKWLSNRKAIGEKKLDVKLADLENQARLLRDTQQANTSWETEQIKQADRWARRFLLASLWFPFYAWWVDPARAADYFKFVAEAPPWYTGLCVSATMAVFGLRKMLQWRQYKRAAPKEGTHQ